MLIDHQLSAPWRTRFVALLILCFACAGAWRVASQEHYPDALETYTVVGVAAGDELSIRAEPTEGEKPSDWKVLGGIPANSTQVLATGLSKQIDSQRWAEVVFQSLRGWVNTKFLQAASTSLALLQEKTFDCLGTEPFWKLTLGPKHATYNDAGVEGLSLTTERAQPAQG